jgi:hypothetical protein
VQLRENLRHVAYIGTLSSDSVALSGLWTLAAESRRVQKTTRELVLGRYEVSTRYGRIIIQDCVWGCACNRA